jgi:circadian clock protein KaiC
METIVRRRDTWAQSQMPFGIAGLDELLGGGLTEGTSTVVAGSPGTGKTLLALHFLAEGTRQNEPTLLVEFNEDVAQLRAQSQMFDLDGLFAPDNETATILELPAYEMEADVIAHQIIDVLDQRGTRRLVIDSATELQRAVDPIRQTDYFAALIDALRARKVTTLFTFDVPTIVGADLTFANSPLAILAENLILLRQREANGALHRALAILKLRFGIASLAFHPYTIRSPEGIEVHGTSEQTGGGDYQHHQRTLVGAGEEPSTRGS